MVLVIIYNNQIPIVNLLINEANLMKQQPGYIALKTFKKPNIWIQ